MRSKKATISWDEIGKWILIVIAILIALYIILKLSGASNTIWERIKEALRFGI